jgi:hypothetical protein
MFKYHNSETLLRYVGRRVKYLDLSGKEKTSLLRGGNGKRTWLQDVACHPYADTVLVCLV